MPDGAKEGTILAQLVAVAIPALRAAEREVPRRGPGAPLAYPDWKMAGLIMVAVLVRRKSKSAQYRYLEEHRDAVMRWLALRRFPARSTYFARYGQTRALFEKAVALQGQRLLEEKVTKATVVAVDKSLLPAQGRVWHQRERRAGRRPRGVDPEAGWGYSEHHDWVYGYSYEVVVSAGESTLVCPLLVSVGTAGASEHHSFQGKIEQLPRPTRCVLADAGYDSNAHGEAIEYGASNQRTGRRFVCPLQSRGGTPPVGRYPHRGRRERSRRRRARRWAFYRSREGRRLYRRRAKTVEPFNEWFKGKFDLHQRVWHRGLANNATQILAAMFGYQALLRYHHRIGGRNGRIQWILDKL
jgi:hypothetical protein